jgi:hypothetical protein
MKRGIVYESDTVLPDFVKRLIGYAEEYIMADRREEDKIAVHCSWLQNKLTSWFAEHTVGAISGTKDYVKWVGEAEREKQYDVRIVDGGSAYEVWHTLVYGGYEYNLYDASFFGKNEANQWAALKNREVENGV